ncbi:MAG: molecular chaperone TorD family protein [Burkholderiaceae bacterium]|jgi:TorA maturation chaperone TorD|nr:molecular chaperone TorD family protein [Burkholderiaceae bacterium]
MHHPSAAPPATTVPQAVWQLAAEDLRALAWLHAQERDPQVLQALHASGFPQSLSLLADGHPAKTAMAAALQAIAGQIEGLLPVTADDLAADYAAIYLNHTLRASPYESVWLDEDHLMLQAPTFAVRAFYRKHGVHIANWRQMPEDHIAHELSFVALLLESGQEKEAARFLKTHLLAWLPDFAARVVQRADTPFYAALAALTQACVDACAARLPRVAVIAQPVVVAAAAPPNPEYGCTQSDPCPSDERAQTPPRSA